MTSEPRAATIRAVEDTVCLLFSRSVFEEVISGSTALLGQDSHVNVDWSTDHETRSLFKHIENILDIESNPANQRLSVRVKRILYELATAFTPELSPDEVGKMERVDCPIRSLVVLLARTGHRSDGHDSEDGSAGR
jgi:CRP-like cAMP-binding protein